MLDLSQVKESGISPFTITFHPPALDIADSARWYTPSPPASTPPSTGSITPVTQVALAKYSTASAMSFGVPYRPNGCMP